MEIYFLNVGSANERSLKTISFRNVVKNSVNYAYMPLLNVSRKSAAVVSVFL